MPTFTLKIIPRPHQPRSKRLKAISAAAAAVASSAANSSSSSTQNPAESHTHPNLSILNSIITQESEFTTTAEATDSEGNPVTVTTKKPTRYLSLTTADTEGNTIVKKIAAEYADAAAVLTPDSPTRQQFLSSEEDDEALGSITFRALQHFVEGIVSKAVRSETFTSGFTGEGYALQINEDGKSSLEIDTITVRQIMNVFERIVSKAIRSETFTSGFTGEGYALQINEDGKSTLEIDCLTVRQLMTVFELIIQKIRAVAGQLVVSPANAKVKSVSFYSDDVKSRFSITTEEECPFLPGDLVRCQVFSGSRQKSYWVEVLTATSKGFSVDAASFEEWGCRPEVGDELVLLGSTTHPERQAAISITAAGDGKPRIDILSDISSQSTQNALRARIGDLSGISDPRFLEKQPEGHGIYTDNAFLHGTFVLRNGLDVRTSFAITEDKIKSSVSAVRQDFIDTQGYLANPSFLHGLDCWEAQNDAALYAAGATLIIAESEILAAQSKGAAVITDAERPALRIANSEIIQRNARMRQLPVIITDATGLKLPALVNFAILAHVITPGTLTVTFLHESTDGFAPTQKFLLQRQLETTDSYTQISATGPWTATGDFSLAYTGEIRIRSILLTSDPVESFTKRYRTLFEQSSNLVKLAAAIYDHDEQLIQESGLLIRPEGSGLYLQKADGSLALIGVAEEKTGEDGQTRTVIHLTSDHIALEGLVTANGYFRILTDGSIETQNAKIGGYIYSNFKPIENSDATLISPGTYKLNSNLYILSFGDNIILPVEKKYEGARVIIANTQFWELRIPQPPTTLTIQDGAAVFHAGFLKNGSYYGAQKIEFKAGSVELVLASIPNEEGKSSFVWVILSHSCAYFDFS